MNTTEELPTYSSSSIPNSFAGMTACLEGDTAIALHYGEFRESLDLDFFVSDRDGYRELRQLIRRAGSLMALWQLEGIHIQEEGSPSLINTESAPG
ncbi:MAG: hypothetical protein NTW02_03845 [Cyanobium sp. LacPavin_0920_WC12_MAG_62_9]|nr:hypothetical protein [Cyanobium sp. LacPavin_0920_WC12_MAG_62_9]